jgi:DNA-binding response OmpR family regulator
MPRKRRRILLVDDDSAVLLSLKAILEISGFEVDSASSAAQARLRLRSSQYHMVITDMKMEEDRAGFQVIKAARESGFNPAIAILTAYPVEGSEWKEEGAHSMLVKPLATDVLLRQIEALLVQHEDRKRSSSN